MPQTSSEIRQAFLDFFKSKGHVIVPSSSIVVKNDPTLMFTNAGMNQFKDFFLGNKQPDFKRATDTQKCLRVSGKHNDLEEVGVDTYHHTMFEMLGNWSFGDYFKEEAIAWAWELLTEVYRIDKDRLYVTVFEGDQQDGLPKDTEAEKAWAKWISEDRILTGNKHDNFWEMGDTGPCGPCSEIHVDCRPDQERNEIDGKTLVNADHPQVIEIWNLVFMQFNRKRDGSLEALPAKHVDTGMGFERLVRILQGKSSNYDTDIFTDTIKVIESILDKKYDFSDSQEAIAFRVLSDHIRAISFAIADGQLPSNTGAGYVIRRILRRAVRYYYSCLEWKEPLLYRLVEHISSQFETVFPELKKQEVFVSRVIKEEEESFLRTLESGLKRMEILIANSKGEIDGAAAFELYDTYGFPLDLTRLIATEHHLTIDKKGFDKEMAAQKDRARQATSIDAGDWVVLEEGEENHFIGYDQLEAESKVMKYRKVKAKNKTQYQIVLEQTPFYGEMGGQVGDQGNLKFGNQTLKVLDTQKENDLIIHITENLAEDMTVPVFAQVDGERRLKIKYNHSATHLLHAALKKVLGKHVNQKGSLVSPDILRFDISHFAKMTDDEIHQVADLVNQKIRENIPVKTVEMPKEEALKTGAMALFGEKYGDLVRVVTMDPNFSIELCGGTHVSHTGQIGTFVITSESAVAAGVRRIEALTGNAALQYMLKMMNEHRSIAALLKSQDPIKTVEKLLEEKTGLEKKVAGFEAGERSRQAKEMFSTAEEINGVRLISGKVKVENGGDLKKAAFEFDNLGDNLVVLLTANISGKASVALMLSSKLVAEKGWDASKLIRETISPLIQGGGGGQKNMATAGGKDLSHLDQLAEILKKQLFG